MARVSAVLLSVLMAAAIGFWLIPSPAQSWPLERPRRAVEQSQPVAEAPQPTPRAAIAPNLPPATVQPPMNQALASLGTLASGGGRPELLNDANFTQYNGGEGYAFSGWQAKPPECFILTFKTPTQLNLISFLLWDQEPQRFYRYKLELSGEAEGTAWRLIADCTAPKDECRGWQHVGFSTQPVKRIRLTGTYNSANHQFHVVELQAFLIAGNGALDF